MSMSRSGPYLEIMKIVVTLRFCKILKSVVEIFGSFVVEHV